MEPTSHKRRNIIIVIVLIIILILVLRNKPSVLFNGPAGLSETEKAQIIEELNRQAGDSPSNLTVEQRSNLSQDLQSDKSTSGAIQLSEEQKLEIIKNPR